MIDETMMQKNSIEKPSGTPLLQITDVNLLQSLVEKLWNIIDDIDTFSDMAKSDDRLYRALVERKQAERWSKTPITTDGYVLLVGRARR